MFHFYRMFVLSLVHENLRSRVAPIKTKKVNKSNIKMHIFKQQNMTRLRGVAGEEIKIPAFKMERV